MEKKIIKPRLAAGFKDYLPGDMIPRQWMFDTIRRVFELFGFVPLDTPGLEIEEILTGGDENFHQQIFRTDKQVGWDPFALRFDLTVPLARVIAQYPEIKKPFKRYQTGKVWRAEKPQAGRYREFVQFDADIVGSSSMMADAEIIAIMDSTMRALGVEKFLIRINNRKILNGLPEFAGFPEERTTDVLRTIDKIDKQGWESVAEELQKPVNEGGAEIPINSLEKIERFLELRNFGSDPKGLLLKVRDLMFSSQIASVGVLELIEVIDYIGALGVPNGSWTIDLSVARGLGYYTGPVFETMLTNLPSIGSVFSGGRFDNLIERFGPVSVPATGASVGVDRLFAGMKELGLIGSEKSVAKVMILNFDSSCHQYVQEVAKTVRQAGIPADIYLGKETNIRAQITYALNSGVPLIIIAGSAERDKKTVSLKDTRTREQKEVALSELAGKIGEEQKTE